MSEQYVTYVIREFDAERHKVWEKIRKLPRYPINHLTQTMLDELATRYRALEYIARGVCNILPFYEEHLWDNPSDLAFVERWSKLTHDRSEMILARAETDAMLNVATFWAELSSILDSHLRMHMVVDRD